MTFLYCDKDGSCKNTQKIPCPRSSSFSSHMMAASSGYKNSDVVIVAARRTPIGNLNGCLSTLKAHELGAIVIRDVLAQAKISPSDVSEVIMGQVFTAGNIKAYQ